MIFYKRHGLWWTWPMAHVPWGRLRKGDSRLLVLEILRKRPMNGYEVGKEISGMFCGLYEPSPGAVYPTLQWLEDAGYVKVEQVDGKRVYSITEQGIKYLEERRSSLEGLMKTCDQLMKTEKTQLFITGRKLAQTILILLSEGSEEKLREAAAILEDARKRLTELTLR